MHTTQVGTRRYYTSRDHRSFFLQFIDNNETGLGEFAHQFIYADTPYERDTSEISGDNVSLIRSIPPPQNLVSSGAGSGKKYAFSYYVTMMVGENESFSSVVIQEQNTLPSISPIDLDWDADTQATAWRIYSLDAETGVHRLRDEVTGATITWNDAALVTDWFDAAKELHPIAPNAAYGYLALRSIPRSVLRDGRNR